MVTKKAKNIREIKQWFQHPIFPKMASWLVKFFKFCKENSEAIRNWLIVVFTAIFAFYTYRLFEFSVTQTKISEKIEAASIDIRQSFAEQMPGSRFHTIIVTTEIANVSQKTLAKNVEIESRLDLLEKDFDEGKIAYTKPIKEFSFISGFNDIKMFDTLNLSTKLIKIDDIGNNLWPFLHMRIKYDNGFGKRSIRNFGFSYDINSNERKICKHTYIESDN